MSTNLKCFAKKKKTKKKREFRSTKTTLISRATRTHVQVGVRPSRRCSSRDSSTTVFVLRGAYIVPHGLCTAVGSPYVGAYQQPLHRINHSRRFSPQSDACTKFLLTTAACMNKCAYVYAYISYTQ